VKICTFIHQYKSSLVTKALEFFGCSENCGIFISREKIAEALCLNGKKVDEVVKKLRELRFDIRTFRTHPTIRSDEIICTYPFPLLSDKAQLERKIRA